MKTIKLFCAGGMSTGMLVIKMKEAANVLGFDYAISAHSINDIEVESQGCDCILLGPQVGYRIKEIQTMYASIPSAVIDMVAYGMMDGKKVITQVSQLLKKV